MKLKMSRPRGAYGPVSWSNIFATLIFAIVFVIAVIGSIHTAFYVDPSWHKFTTKEGSTLECWGKSPNKSEYNWPTQCVVTPPQSPKPAGASQ